MATGRVGHTEDNLRAKAVKQAGGISLERIWDWMHRNNFSLDTAVEALGISRRMLAYYRDGQKPLPGHIWLAYVGWEAHKNKAAQLAKGGEMTVAHNIFTCIAWEPVFE